MSIAIFLIIFGARVSMFSIIKVKLVVLLKWPCRSPPPIMLTFDLRMVSAWFNIVWRCILVSFWCWLLYSYLNMHNSHLGNMLVVLDLGMSTLKSRKKMYYKMRWQLVVASSFNKTIYQSFTMFSFSTFNRRYDTKQYTLIMWIRRRAWCLRKFFKIFTRRSVFVCEEIASFEGHVTLSNWRHFLGNTFIGTWSFVEDQEGVSFGQATTCALARPKHMFTW